MNWLRKFFCLVVGHQRKLVSKEVLRQDSERRRMQIKYRCIYCGDTEYYHKEEWK